MHTDPESARIATVVTAHVAEFHASQQHREGEAVPTVESEPQPFDDDVITLVEITLPDEHGAGPGRLRSFVRREPVFVASITSFALAWLGFVVGGQLPRVGPLLLALGIVGSTVAVFWHRRRERGAVKR